MQISESDKELQAELRRGEEDIRIFHNPVTLATRLISSTIIFGAYDTVVALVYSVLVAMICLVNKLVRLEIIVSAVVETTTAFTDPNACFVLVIIVCCLNMLLQMALAYTRGYIRLAYMNFVVYPIVGAAIVFFELFVLGIFYGFRVFFSNTTLMVYGVAKAEAKKVKMFMNTVVLADWSVVLPICCVFMITCAVVYDQSLHFNALDMFSWLWIIIVLLPIPGLMLYSIYYQYSLGNSIRPLFKRNPDLWGPRTRSNRIEAERAERMIRQWW
ncbi:hypothetical protein GCK32_014936 [Trichostrongylus colubriformis]|uniref:Uncharacterized protein n=1 Tax=Trichostrongylus colubriformis TaxID=6319 RepID=A0AAN8FVE0_TRICO